MFLALRPALNRGVLFAAFLLLSLSVASAALSVGPGGRIQVAGFVSQGWLKSSGNNYPFEAKDGTFDFREYAINASTTFGTHLRVGAQVYGQSLGNYGEDQPILDWAVADYNFRPEFGVRAGRIKFPKGLYGEALDLDSIRPFIFLPTNVYNPILRDFYASFDGAMLYGTVGVGRAGSVDYKLFYGDIALDTDMGVADFWNSASFFAAPGVKQLGVDNVRGASLDWLTPTPGLKFHASYSELKNILGRGQFALMPVLPVSLAVDISFTTVGVEYVQGDWTFAAEWHRQTGPVHILAAPVVDNHSHYGNDNYYFSVARRIAGKWEIGGYYSHSGDRFPGATAPSADKHLNDIVLSVRYDVNEHLTVKVEGHSIDGRYNLLDTTKNPNPAPKDSMSYVAVKTTYSF